MGWLGCGQAPGEGLGSLGPQLPFTEVSGQTRVNLGKALGGDPLSHAAPRPGLASGHCEVGQRGSKGRNLKPMVVSPPGRARVPVGRGMQWAQGGWRQCLCLMEGLGAARPCA